MEKKCGKGNKLQQGGVAVIRGVQKSNKIGYRLRMGCRRGLGLVHRLGRFKPGLDPGEPTRLGGIYGL